MTSHLSGRLVRFQPSLSLLVAGSVLLIGLSSGGCLDRTPVPGRPAATPFDRIGDIELLAHRGGTSIDTPDSNDNDSTNKHDVPGPAAAAPTTTDDDSSSADPAADNPAVPDSRLQLLIRRRLADEAIDTTGLDITVDHGRVVLSGRVASQRQRDRIEITVRFVDAVEKLVNRLDISDPPRD